MATSKSSGSYKKLIKENAVARADERPQAASRTREGVAGSRSEAEGASDEPGEV